MLSLYCNVLCVILIFHFDYCTLSKGQQPTIDQWVAGEGQEEHTNSTHQFDFKSSHISTLASSELRSKRDTLFLAGCSEVQPKLVHRYYYKFGMSSSRTFLNQIDVVSVGYAFLLAFESNVLKKPLRYFDITDFLNNSGIVFPPTLPLVCYDTAYTLHESPLFNYGKDDILRDLDAAAGSPRSHTRSGINYIPPSATRHLNPSSGYMVQRRKLYRELGNLLQNLRHGQQETLKTKCMESLYTKTTDLISELLGNNTLQAMSPKYFLEQFNEVAKLFIGDIVAYEIIRQACMAVDITEHATRFPQITPDDWKPIADKLSEASDRIRNNWHETQLQADILESDLDWYGASYRKDRPSKTHSGLESLFQRLHASALLEKYYQYGFRVSSHEGWGTGWAPYNVLIPEICEGRRNQKCIRKDGKLFIVKWKSLKPSEQSALYETPLPYITLPKLTPPPSLFNFAALYTKVETDLKKVQNAVNYFRVNELRKSHYKNVSNLIHTFENSAGYNFYSETAGRFAKTLDTVNVFRTEFQPLINTLSEVAMHVGEEGIDKVWLLIDRSFFEMDFYMADIEEHIMQMRLKFKEKYAPILAPSVDDTYAKEFLFGDHPFEEITKIRDAFQNYQEQARFYVKPGNVHAPPVVVKEFIDKCGALKSVIETLPTGSTAFLMAHGMKKLGNRGPFYLQTLLLPPSYDIIYLTLYSIFCASQRYRWLAERNLVSFDGRMSTADVQHFIRSTQQDVSDISKKLDELVEVISIYIFEGEFYWVKRLWNEISLEPENNITDVNAERLANKLNVLFPWNRFAVNLIKPDAPNYMIDEIRSKMYYYKFLSNPDYSLLLMNPDTEYTVIVNWALDSGVRPGGEGFDFGPLEKISYPVSDWLSVCGMPPSYAVSRLTGYQNIKSFFMWRIKIGYGWHPDKVLAMNAPADDMRSFRKVYSNSHFGTSRSIKHSNRTCWHFVYYSSTICLSRGWETCYKFDQAGMFVLGNFGGDY